LIRRIGPADRAAYLALASEFYRTGAVLSPVPAENFVRTFEELMRSDEYASGYLLTDGGRPAGYALLSRTFSQEAGGMVVWLEELYVRPEYRGRGHARAFFRYLEAHEPAVRYRLELEPENERAAALYRRMGYRPMPYAQMVREIKTGT